MSVAFRRESDEEQKEPTFELPIPPGPNLVTARGFAQIEAKVESLAAEVSVEADEARRATLKRDLRYWQTRRVTAEVVSPPTDGGIGLGSRATVRVAGKERNVTIVGGDEADPRAGLIGFHAPLARALLGLAAGEQARFGSGFVVVMAVEVDDG